MPLNNYTKALLNIANAQISVIDMVGMAMQQGLQLSDPADAELFHKVCKLVTHVRKEMSEINDLGHKIEERV